ncbi:hypothetical protein EYF80_016903 [Liparis tanakae]|uniref:Uncharacterized protein n=1 Tax=Liparis tanakae TaxID=230148 RepID=A0A4Z2I675_9TELE|nr:hypothetical protein EYF80_016903 [Liparis tanakae]
MIQDTPHEDIRITGLADLPDPSLEAPSHRNPSAASSAPQCQTDQVQLGGTALKYLPSYNMQMIRKTEQFGILAIAKLLVFSFLEKEAGSRAGSHFHRTEWGPTSVTVSSSLYTSTGDVYVIPGRNDERTQQNLGQSPMIRGAKAEKQQEDNISSSLSPYGCIFISPSHITNSASFPGDFVTPRLIGSIGPGCV